MKNRVIQLLVLAMFCLNASIVPFVKAQPAQSEEPVRFEISPGIFERSKEYTVVIRNQRCLDDANGVSPSVSLGKAKVESANGIKIVKILGASPCSITVKISIEETAQFTKVPLPILDEKDKLIGHCTCEIVAKIPGPISPGLDGPQVDLLWSVLPDKLVDDAFGERVRKRYFGIEVIIGNNSGYDLQIASVGFNLSKDVIDTLGLQVGAKKWENQLSASGYRLVRAAIEKTQEVGGRNRAIFMLETVAGIGTGGIPFFRNANPRANYSTIVSIFSNPFLTGLKLIFPDRTISQFTRLDDLALRSDFIISNNTQARRVVFFPKEILCAYFQEIKPKKEKTKVNCDNPPPLFVMKALGELVLVGQQIRYENRIRIVNTPVPQDGAGGSKSLKAQNTKTNPIGTGVSSVFSRLPFRQGEEATIEISGVDLKTSDLRADHPDIKISKPKLNDDRTVLTATIEVSQDVPAGEHSILVSTDSGVKETTITVGQKPVVTELTFGVSGSETVTVDEVKNGVTLTVVGKNLQNLAPYILDSAKCRVGELQIEKSETGGKLVLSWKYDKPKSGGSYKLVLQVTPNSNEPVTKEFKIK